MNRLIAHRLGAGAQAIKPVYEGHLYYPFPALRPGPSIRQVVECSNLSREAIDLTLVAARPCLFRACFRAWAGIPLPRNADVVNPLHPWQLELSPVVRELLKRRWIAVHRLAADVPDSALRFRRQAADRSHIDRGRPAALP
jgi:hypothetical protein